MTNPTTTWHVAACIPCDLRQPFALPGIRDGWTTLHRPEWRS